MLQLDRGSGPEGLGSHPLVGKKIFIPPMAYGSGRAFAAGFRSLGVDADITPPSDHRTKELGARYTSGDECYPAKVTVGDFMRVLEAPGADPSKIVLFMPTADGPCRFGQYAPYLKNILDANGYGTTEVLSPTSNNGYAGSGQPGQTVSAHRLAHAGGGRHPAEDAAQVPPARAQQRRHRRGVRGVSGRFVRDGGKDALQAGRAASRRARRHGALSRAFPLAARRSATARCR